MSGRFAQEETEKMSPRKWTVVEIGLKEIFQMERHTALNTALKRWLIVLAIMIQFGWSSHLHMLTAPLNLILRSTKPKGALEPIDIENSETFGVNKITEFTRKQLLDCFACISCGRCQDACPAYASEKPLNPKELIQDLNRHLRKVAPGMLKGEEDTTSLIGEVIEEETAWSCTTCRSCMEVCPVANEHMPKIVESI